MAVVITAAHGVVIKLWNAAAFTAIDGIFNGPNGQGGILNLLRHAITGLQLRLRKRRLLM